MCYNIVILNEDRINIMKKRKHGITYLLTPDYMFNTFDEITPEFLSSIGIKALLIDIDNTLAPYEQPEPDEKTINWFASLGRAGISASLISNNHPPRVELFNQRLGLDAYADSGKPKSETLIKAMKKMGSDESNTAVLGDQLLTDALGGHRLGLVALIVPPIKDKTTPFFKFKRWIEKPYIKKYRRSHNEERN